jgi:DNA-binding NarL/FixJ family response regulator
MERGRGPIAVLLLAEAVAVSEALADCLERQGSIRVCALTHTADDALRAARDEEPEVAVLLLACPMGPVLCRRIISASPPTRVLALGVPEEERCILRWAESGALGCLVTSASMDDVADAVRRLAVGEPICPPLVATALLRRVASVARSAQIRSARPPLADPGLTIREVEVMALAVEGLSNKEIASALLVEIPTVKNHMHSIFQKLHVQRRTELSALADLFDLPTA